MIARFAIGTFSSVLEDLLTVTSCLDASSCLTCLICLTSVTSVTSVTSCLNFEDALDWSTSDNVRRFGSFWIVLHVSVTVELSSLCDEEMQDVQLENFLLMKEDASLEEAKQGQRKSKARARDWSSI